MSKTTYKFPNGVHTVLVTPFNENTLNVDYDDIQQWVSFQANTNVAGLVLLGTTSESPTLSRDEQLKIVKLVYSLNKSTMSPKFITVGVGGNNTKEALEFARECVGYCDAFMVTVPHYNKPPQRGIVEHFKTICNHDETKNTPVIFYNVPGRTSLNADPETIRKVFEECPSVVAVKEASGSMDQVIRLRTIVPDLKVFSGDDKLVLDVMIHGGVGVISVASNVIPDVMTHVVNSCLDQDFKEAKNVFYTGYLPGFIDSLFCETNPIPVKFMMKEVHIYKSDVMRQPLVTLDENKKKFVLDALYQTAQAFDTNTAFNVPN
jgi:4-hydroxy-tetrahydrodipicolinate synthase